MAKFNAQGIEGLELSLKEFAEIPDDVVEEMLDAASEVVVAAHKQKIQSLGLVDTGKLVNSIKAHKKAGSRSNGFHRYVLVYPTGKHNSYNRKKVTKVYKNSKHGRTYDVGGDVKNVTNNDVGFVLEYGAPKRGKRAYQWMRSANEESADAVAGAEFAIYDKWLKTKGL